MRGARLSNHPQFEEEAIVLTLQDPIWRIHEERNDVQALARTRPGCPEKGRSAMKRHAPRPANKKQQALDTSKLYPGPLQSEHQIAC